MTYSEYKVAISNLFKEDRFEENGLSEVGLSEVRIVRARSGMIRKRWQLVDLVLGLNDLDPAF